MPIRWMLWAGLVLTGCAGVTGGEPAGDVNNGVTFSVVAPEARSVAVAGTFNGWSPVAHPMARTQPNGSWSTVVSLPPGDYSFMYVVNGVRWVTPPGADDFVADGFGQINGVRTVR